MSAAWWVLAVGLSQAPGAAGQGASDAALPTLGLPGLVLVGGSAEDRALLDQQLAAALEGAGFTVKDAAALSAAGASVPPGGCEDATLQPLCGAAPGVDQLVLGRVVRDQEGAAMVLLQLVKSPGGRQVWRGTFEVSNEAELVAGLNTVAMDHLPPVARKANLPEPPRTMGLTRRDWGATTFLAGTLLSVGSGVLFWQSERMLSEITGRYDVSRPPPRTRDVLARGTTIPMLRAGGTAAAVLGAVGLVGGALLWADSPPPPVSFSFSPTGDAGAVVFTGVLP